MPCAVRGGLIICSREKRKTCHVCGKPAVALCDATRKDSLPCDNPMCEEHRIIVGEDTDVCRYHNYPKYIKQAIENRQNRQKQKKEWW